MPGGPGWDGSVWRDMGSLTAEIAGQEGGKGKETQNCLIPGH